MLIGELSNRTGLTRDTIRFYEKQGLIKVGRRERRLNNYKEYSDAVLRKLLLLNKIKSYGFTLNESAEIIALLDENLASCDKISQTVDKKINVIDKKITELQALRNLLKESVDSCNTGCCGNKQSEANCPLFEINV